MTAAMRLVCAVALLAAGLGLQLVQADVAMAMNGAACYVNSSLELIVDTSISTDPVAMTMKAALNNLGDPMNGVILSFNEYFLSTWAFPANQTHVFPSIHDLQAFFLAYGLANVRIQDPVDKHNDFKYMWDSLTLAIDHAELNGVIIVLGDQDQLCDARSDFFGGTNFGPYSDNDPRFAAGPAMIAQAQSKNVRVSFFYVFTEDPYGGASGNEFHDPNGCPYLRDRVNTMNWLTSFATQTGGVANYSMSPTVQMGNLIKSEGMRPAVCNNTCTANATLGIVLDTSGSTVPVHDKIHALFDDLDMMALGGALVPFKAYELSTFGTPASTILEWKTFYELNQYIQDPASGALDDVRKSLDPVTPTGNDWKYTLESVEQILPHVGVDGYIIVITDQEGVCDVTRFNEIYAQRWQDVVNGAIAKRITVSFYTMADGDDGAHAGVLPPDCSALLRTPGDNKLIAMAQILGGQAGLDLDATTLAGIENGAKEITMEVVQQSMRPVCSNCTHNATLTFIVDSSASEAPSKSLIRAEFAHLATLPPSTFASYFGGFLVNTWAFHATDFFAFSSIGDVNTFFHTYYPVDPLDANRATWDMTSHQHDDWGYMLDSLGVALTKIGQDGVVIIISNYDQICDATKFWHSAAELTYYLQLAGSLNAQLNYYVMATPVPYCDDAGRALGISLAMQLTSVTGGQFYFAPNTSDIAGDLMKIEPQIAAGGARPVCPRMCPPNYVWAGNKCIEVNPCVGSPCCHGGTCVPEFYTQHFECVCDQDHYGPLCQYHCVPSSTSTNISHALGIVIDTSASSHDDYAGMMAVVTMLGTPNFHFDKYLLSTWAFTLAANNIVQTFPNMAALATVLADPNTQLNNRLVQDGGNHNDWLYMLDSVQNMIPLMGSNGVLFILADQEQVCDADPTARLNPDMTPKYPANPLHWRVLAINAMALAAHIKIFYVTFPSYHSGLCHTNQRVIGVNEAKAMVYGTSGYVFDQPEALGLQSLADVTDQLYNALNGENTVQRCVCPNGFLLSNDLCIASP